ncbi:MAG: DUF1612 and helix-turn-helix domain-containing protein [Rhodobiaceae bacterium]|nr:DUF1612 and helix-turn-helix domain-containing protein [Rhodobiaceae bacterium]
MVNTQDAISRLDERAKRQSALKESDREGWSAQRILHDACDAQWISGHLVDAHDLILHESGAAPGPGDPPTLRARHRIRLHAQLMRARRERAITPEEIFRIFGRGPKSPENDLALYDPDENHGETVEAWCHQWSELLHEPALLQVGRGLLAWAQAPAFTHATVADLLLLGERMARASRLTSSAPLALATGARRTKWRPLGVMSEEEFLADFLHAVEATAEVGMHQLDELELWRERAGHHLETRRRSSGVSQVLNLVAAKGVVSTRSIADETSMTVQSAARLCNELTAAGLLRELSGQKHFRVWGRG